MLRMKPSSAGVSSPAKFSHGIGIIGPEAGGWEMRPGGMLVQKRNSDSNQTPAPVPNIRVRVKFGSFFHEINISSQASFGDLKKMLAGTTGLHHQDQKLIFKDMERDSRTFLDMAGVKDGSKIVLSEDVISKERRYLELCTTAKIDKATKEIAEIRLEVDKLSKQVADLESEICCGKKVSETILLNLIETLMTKLIKLDGIVADGDVKLKRRMQVKRVQKYIETLDVLKIKNSTVGNNGIKIPLQQLQRQQDKMAIGQMATMSMQKQAGLSNVAAGQNNPFLVTSKWETLDSVQIPFTYPPTVTHSNYNPSAKIKWELFE